MKTSKGFTLIELAIVIAIVAVLAAVAVPKFQNAEAGAERGVMKDMVSQLTSAMAIYTARYGRTPTGFTDFVTTAAVPTGKYSIALGGFGPGAPAASCTPTATDISCGAGVFKKWTGINYSFNGGAPSITTDPTWAATAGGDRF